MCQGNQIFKNFSAVADIKSKSLNVLKVLKPIWYVLKKDAQNLHIYVQSQTAANAPKLIKLAT